VTGLRADLRVYAVWFHVLWTDARWTWSPDRLEDRRVTQYWDSTGATGRWFMDNVTHRRPGKVEWDAYFLYPAAARWGAVPTPLTSWGRTVVASGPQLRQDLLSLLSQVHGAPR
jgi:hypothetical protein